MHLQKVWSVIIAVAAVKEAAEEKGFVWKGVVFIMGCAKDKGKAQGLVRTVK